MNERVFVSKLLGDKEFLKTAAESIPDDVLEELAEKGKAQGAQQQNADLGPTMCEYFLPAAQAMGYTFDPLTFGSECEAQMKAMGAFAKIGFLGRFVKTLAKVDKQRKKRMKRK